jgi:hypothetical protein
MNKGHPNSCRSRRVQGGPAESMAKRLHWSCATCSLENVELTAVPTARASAAIRASMSWRWSGPLKRNEIAESGPKNSARASCGHAFRSGSTPASARTEAHAMHRLQLRFSSCVPVCCNCSIHLTPGGKRSYSAPDITDPESL